MFFHKSSHHIDHPEGFLLVDKPIGCSSFQMIYRLRKLCSVQKIGHAGTLDPFASGLLIIGIGKTYTRQLEDMVQLPKTYVGTMVLGIETDTLDSYGQVLNRTVIDSSPLLDKIPNTVSKFIGPISQIPPQFSAKKKEGKVAYQMAQSNQEIQLSAQDIHIYDLCVTPKQLAPFPILEIKTHCSKGTYVRQLAYDIAKDLGTVAYLNSLRRTQIGPYSIKDAISIESLAQIQAACFRELKA